jgi:hypothetical protein
MQTKYKLEAEKIKIEARSKLQNKLETKIIALDVKGIVLEEKLNIKNQLLILDLNINKDIRNKIFELSEKIVKIFLKIQNLKSQIDSNDLMTDFSFNIIFSKVATDVAIFERLKEEKLVNFVRLEAAIFRVAQDIFKIENLNIKDKNIVIKNMKDSQMLKKYENKSLKEYLS